MKNKRCVPLSLQILKKRWVLILVVMACALFSHGQADSITQSRIWIKTNPIDYVLGYNGKIANLGIECRLAPNYSLASELGFYYSISNSSETFFNNTGLRIKEEIKHYSAKNSGKWLGYYSLELAYGNHSFDRTDSLLYITPPNSYEGYTKLYHVSKEFYGLLVQRGFIRQFPCGFILELYVGIGLRYNQVKSNLSADELAHRSFGDSTLPFDLSLQEGNHIVPRINLGVKVGFRVR
jgi:hypothetical protein